MRTQIFNLIASIKPHDDIEAKHIQETLEWIQSGAEIFRIQKPDIPSKHLVAYFFIWDPIHQKVLLGDHIKSDLWLPGGGHVERNEHPKDTARREMKEEFGIEADFLLPGASFLTVTETVGPTAGHADISIWFVVRGDSTHIPNADPAEFRTLRWFSLAKIKAISTDPHMQRFITKMQKQIEKQ